MTPLEKALQTVPEPGTDLVIADSERLIAELSDIGKLDTTTASVEDLIRLDYTVNQLQQVPDDLEGKMEVLRGAMLENKEGLRIAKRINASLGVVASSLGMINIGSYAPATWWQDDSAGLMFMVLIGIGFFKSIFLLSEWDDLHKVRVESSDASYISIVSRFTKDKRKSAQYRQLKKMKKQKKNYIASLQKTHENILGKATTAIAMDDVVLYKSEDSYRVGFLSFEREEEKKPLLPYVTSPNVEDLDTREPLNENQVLAVLNQGLAIDEEMIIDELAVNNPIPAIVQYGKPHEVGFINNYEDGVASLATAYSMSAEPFAAYELDTNPMFTLATL